MRQASRRAFLRVFGGGGVVAGLAGCSGDPDGGETATISGVAATPAATEAGTPGRTPTATQHSDSGPGSDPGSAPDLALDGEYGGPLGFEAMFRATPTHPDAPEVPVLWARYVDVGRLLADVDDENHAARLRDGWLGAGPPQSTESDAFELVHLQPGSRSNLTLGYGDFERGEAVETMLSEGWSSAGGGDVFDVLLRDGYAAAIGTSVWLVVSADDADLVRDLAAGIGTEPFLAALGSVDREAMARTASEAGEYRVLERSTVGDGYAAGIALNFGAYRAPVGVLHYAPERGSEWVRAERRFHSVPGEVRSDDFDGEGRVV
jgi:hypothetical protein